MSLKKLFFLNIFLALHASLSGDRVGYRFKLDIGNPDILCPEPGYICPNGQLHYLCQTEAEIAASDSCPNYEPVVPTASFKKSLVQGTNGIRNKIASDLGISNMNIVHWSDQLSEMAIEFTRECIRGDDPCLILGENKIRVSQNYVFFNGKMQERAAARIVRSWFREMGTDVQNWRGYRRKHMDGYMNSLTTMIYPLIEFMGCGGARMYNGHFVVCYYHPPYNKSEFPKNFANGFPCTNCPEFRPTCSKTFTSLCGLDIYMAGASFPNLDIYALLTGIFLSFYIHVLYGKN